MSVLVDRDILAAIECGGIFIDPFDRKCLGTNSYDVHLAPTLRIYAKYREAYSNRPEPLDLREPRETVDIEIPESGIVLEPGELYLAATVEYTESRDYVPMLNGRSSIGRSGLSIHVTAGTGDVGFNGHWTMELFVVKRLRVYAGAPVGQLLWLKASGAPDVPYDRKPSAKYNNAESLPVACRLHTELAKE